MGEGKMGVLNVEAMGDVTAQRRGWEAVVLFMMSFGDAFICFSDSILIMFSQET